MPGTEATRQLIATEFRRLRREERVLIGLLLVAFVAAGWTGDHRSCQRSRPVRAFIVQDRRINLQAVRYWLDRGQPQIAARIQARIAAERHVTQVACWQLLPGD